MHKRFPTAAGTPAATLALLLAAACGNPTESRPDGGIRVVAGASVSDSISAFLAAPLVVEVRDSTGRAAAGVAVEFKAPTAVLDGATRSTVLFAAVGTDTYDRVLAATTDAKGRAAVRVRLGEVAGPAQVQISAPTVGYSGSAAYTVVPGAANSFSIAPADTALYVGASYTLRIGVKDRMGNALQAPQTTSTAASAVVAVTGNAVSGQALGRTTVAVQSGTFSGTASVSVVPQGALLAARSDGVYAFNLDGSSFRRVVSQAGARSPRWFPDGQRFVYSVGLSHAFVADLAGSTRPLVPGTSLDAELWAHPSRDGAWVYFGGYSGSDFRGYPYRVRPDGTGLQLIPGFTADDVTQASPTPSPDGTRVAFFREEGSSRNVFVRVLNMSTGAVQASVPGHSPAWSYGDSIAYLATAGNSTGPIQVMASNGTGRRTVTDGSFTLGMDWSPENRWIVAHNSGVGRIEVVEVATGRRIPLPYTAGMTNPSWKP